MNWMTIAVMGYFAFGLLLMDFMCPCWGPLEKLIGAVIWPISAVIGIWLSIREAKRDAQFDGALLAFQVGMMLIMADEAVRKELERAKEVSQAQTPVDQAAPHEHRGMGEGMPC